MNYFKVNARGEVLNSNGEVISDDFESESILKSIQVKDNKYMTTIGDIVEVYDFVYVVEEILDLEEGLIKVQAQNGIRLELNPQLFFLSYKDEFIIYTTTGVPTLLTPEAQNQLMDLSDGFSDDDITLKGVRYPTPQWIRADKDVSNVKWWSGLYKENDTGWDLSGPSPVLQWAMQKFKLPKMRVAVLGCGKGHDAHYLSTLGHKVVGFDFSPEAVKEAQALYGESRNLSWRVQNIFELDEKLKGQFDLVFDHTLFCAIDPENRKYLSKAWDFLLAENGQILGIFYIMPKIMGPPYGATEGEIFDRLAKFFRVDYWARSRASIERRLGQELLVLATKTST